MVVLGCGSVGSFLATYITRKNLLPMNQFVLLVDSDKIERSNISNQEFGAHEVGFYKVNSLAMKLQTFRPDLNLYKDGRRVESNNIEEVLRRVSRNDILLDCFDNPLSRTVVSNYARKWGVPCLHVGTSSQIVAAIWDERYDIQLVYHDPNDACQFGNITISALAALVGLEAYEQFHVSGKRVDFVLETNVIKKSEYIR